MTAYVEPPEGWAPRRLVIVALEQLGYRVTEVGSGDTWRLHLG